MNKNFALTFVFYIVLMFIPSGCDKTLQKEYQSPLMYGEKREALFALLEKTGVQHDETLEGILQATQTTWLRPKDKERWEIKDIYKKHTDEFMLLFDTLGMIQSRPPTRNEYDYAIILGATVKRMRKRCAHLIYLWHEGIRFKELVWLVGNRDLDPKLEPKKCLLDPNNNDLPFDSSWELKGTLPINETEAARMIYDQIDMENTFPVPITFVDTPKQVRPDGTISRPRTPDTIAHWLEHNKPRPGSVLAISNQPYTDYQQEVLKACLPSTFMVDTAGTASTEVSITILLDTLARLLYQEYTKACSVYKPHIGTQVPQ